MGSIANFSSSVHPEMDVMRFTMLNIKKPLFYGLVIMLLFPALAASGPGPETMQDRLMSEATFFVA